MTILTRPALRNLFLPTVPRLLCNRLPGTCASPHGGLSSLHHIVIRRLGSDDEMAPTVLLITGFGTILTEWTLLAVGHGNDALAFNAQVRQIVKNGLGPLFCEHEVIGGTPAFVAVPLHFELGGRMHAQPFGIAAERLSSVVAESPAIVTEKYIAEAGSRRGRIFSTRLVHLPLGRRRIILRHGNSRTQPLGAGRIVQRQVGKRFLNRRTRGT